MKAHDLLPELGLVTSRFWFVPRYMFRQAHSSDTRDTPAHFFFFCEIGTSRFESRTHALSLAISVAASFGRDREHRS